MDGSRLGRFTLLEKVGEGGMGRVYKAKDTRLDRLVAIKLLPESRVADADRLGRFVQEAKTASALNHPNIITIYEIGEENGQTFIVMEFVEGKPLTELIPRKGMRFTETLRIAAQVSDALACAHAAGIVHRDLKPANIMVDAHGRVKVLDFGLAKLFVTGASAAAAADESASTVAMDQPVTEEGVILGSIPYMSPEQAEGRPVDARSDIFSFGAVLYEMITGQRAFRGESRASTLAAIVEKDPQPPSETSSTTPPELDRLVARCLRKDVTRRSQNMADVKLALEELRDESESGKLAHRMPAPARAAGGPWLWRGVVGASLLLAVIALTGIYIFHREAKPAVPVLVRFSPDDGKDYGLPAISPDGGFVAFISDKSGKSELWLRQVGGGDPIQLTHADGDVGFPTFFPDGKRILYVADLKGSDQRAIQTIPVLGGQPRVLVTGTQIINHNSMLSPDGSQIAYFEGRRHLLMIISSNGGQPRQLSDWSRMPGASWGRAAWTSDSRYLICVASVAAQEREWFAVPVDGGSPVRMGISDVMRTARLSVAVPLLMVGDRVLFAAGRSADGPFNAWEIQLREGSLHFKDAPRQITFGTLNEWPRTISRTGTVALDVSKLSSEIYMTPLSQATGQPAGLPRRLTRDGRYKLFAFDKLFGFDGGDPGSVYFYTAPSRSDSPIPWHALDLKSGEETSIAELPSLGRLAVSHDGRRIAYSLAEGDSYSIRVGDAGVNATDARLLCKGCGLAVGFSPDGRFLFYQPEARLTPDPARRHTIRLLELDSGKDRPWLTHPTDSLADKAVLPFGNDGSWVAIWPRLSDVAGTAYILPWREDPVPASDWIEVKLPTGIANYSLNADYIYFFQGTALMARRFDSKTRSLGEPFKIVVPPSEFELVPQFGWSVRGPGLAFIRFDNQDSIWLMDLPR